MPAKSPVANLLWLKERSRRMRRSLPPSLHRYHCTHPEKFMGDALVELLCRSDSGRLGMALMKVGRISRGGRSRQTRHGAAAQRPDGVCRSSTITTATSRKRKRPGQKPRSCPGGQQDLDRLIFSAFSDGTIYRGSESRMECLPLGGEMVAHAQIRCDRD